MLNNIQISSLGAQKIILKNHDAILKLGYIIKIHDKETFNQKSKTENQ